MNVAAAVGKRAASVFAESVYDNPVVTREFRTRMRGKRAFGIMGTYVLFLSVVLFLVYYFMVMDSRSQSGGPQLVNQNVGMALFQGLMWTQAILLSLILPALTSGAITQELEKRTIEMLALSRLTAGKITIGKQLSGFLYSLILIVCSIPLASMCLMFGGISPAEIAVSYLLLIGWTFLFTSIGVFWSSLFTRTATASLLTYATCLGYFLFTVIIGSFSQIPYMTGGRAFVYSALNPAWGAFSSLQVAKITGIPVPVSAAAVILHSAIGILLLLVASTHIRHHRVERALPIRIMLLSISAVALWLLVGNSLNFVSAGIITSKMALEALLAFGILTVVILTLAVPIMATGRVCESGSTFALRKIFNLKKTLTGDLRGAVCFMLLWAVILHGVIGLTFWGETLLKHVAADAQFWAAYFGTGMALLAMVLGFSSVAILASSLVTSRKSAAALTFVFMLFAFAVYPISIISYTFYPASGNVIHPIAQIAAWWPPMPFIGMADSWKGYPKVWWSADMSWLVSTIAYLALSILALNGAATAAKKIGGVRED